MEQFQMDLAGRTLTIETGELAKQAGGAVMVGYGDTRVLVTATGSKEAKDIDFFPLTVDYEEKMYAVGRLPGGFIKREARPPETAILNSRLIDRPIRPLFDKGVRNEVHVVATVMSVDQDCDPAVCGMIGASAALSISDVPWGKASYSISPCSLAFCISNSMRGSRSLATLPSSQISTACAYGCWNTDFSWHRRISWKRMENTIRFCGQCMGKRKI